MEADVAVLVGQLCYRQMGWIETYMNSPEVKKRELRCLPSHQCRMVR